MKSHAGIGGEVLSSIEYPYPVVPIVRHHHENWDGTGYPDHLTGTEIPIGARILAVVDCFDALTSDRPYRSKLTDADALAILEERRGLMYDPLVIDAFVEMQEKSRTPTELFVQNTAVLGTHVTVSEPATHLSLTRSLARIPVR